MFHPPACRCLLPPASQQQAALEALVADLPLRIVSLTDEPGFYLALLQVCVLLYLPSAASGLAGEANPLGGSSSSRSAVRRSLGRPAAAALPAPRCPASASAHPALFPLALSWQVPEGYAHPAAPIHLAGAVASGFGRGSRQLGVPTANLPPEPLAAELAGLSDGVYFGWVGGWVVQRAQFWVGGWVGLTSSGGQQAGAAQAGWASTAGRHNSHGYLRV